MVLLLSNRSLSSAALLGCCFLLPCVLSAVGNGGQATNNLTTPRYDGSKLKIEGQPPFNLPGWFEVKEGWPVNDQDYFLATEKGHHFVESQNLPTNLKYDLKVTLEYYYSYSKTKPVVQMTPCTDNIYLVDDQSEDQSRRWITHEYRVRHENCNKRNELAYNILLHDPGDVFAWKYMKIESVMGEFTTTQRTTTSEDSSSLDGLFNEQSNQVATTSPPTTRPPNSTPQIMETSTEMVPAELFSTVPTPKRDEATTQLTSFTDSPERAVTPQRTTVVPDSSISEREPTGTPMQTAPPSTAEPTSEGSVTNPTTAETPVNAASEETPNGSTISLTPLDRGDDPSDANMNKRRRRRAKRATISEYESSTSSYEEHIDYTCVPSNCDKHQFRMARFSPLIKGLPKRPSNVAGQKYFVNLNNSPLKMKIESKNEPISEVDPCLKFQLYMEPGTELELLLADAGPPQTINVDGTSKKPDDKLLEVVSRKNGDSTAGKWEDFQRCISDYMPKYEARGDKEENSMKLILRPKGSQQPGQVGMLISEQGASYLSRPARKQSFLPDIKQFKSAQDLQQYWVVDRDGLRKAQTTSLKNCDQEKAIQISNIDPSQKTFDLTSRWIEIKNAETLELPVLFVYKAEHADWIERVDFQYQRAGDSFDDWISQIAYRAPPLKTPARVTSQSTPAPAPAEASSSNSTTVAPTKSDQQSKKEMQVKSSNDCQDSQMKLIDLPIKLNGLDSSEFRIRVRHYMRPLVSAAPSGTFLSQPSIHFPDRKLNIKSLSFADACSYGRSYCQNKAQCRPTGSAQAECICPQGYSGRFCEHVRPCDVLYSSANGTKVTGNELCQSLGARCIQQLPVMRCEWPNDKYYQCKKLYKLDAAGQSYVLSDSDPSTSDGQRDSQASSDEELSPEDRMNKLKSVVNQQAKLIIILAVFLVAVLIFAVVLVGSMVSRLRKSSRRLKRSQGEVHELSRRTVHPGGFGGSPSSRAAASTSGVGPSGAFNRTKSASPTVIGYNNSAFDVES